MKVLYALRSSGYLYYHLSTIRHLCRNGHQVHLLTDRIEARDGSGQLLQALAEELPGFTYSQLVRRSDLWRGPLFHTRELINYAKYLSLGDQMPWAVHYWERLLPRFLRALTRPSFVQRWLAQPATQRRLKALEKLAPPDAKLNRWLKQHQPDVVVASPVNWRYSEEAEYIKSARALNIPAVVSVLSWDNLSTKGTFHTLPDVLLVWNQQQFEEAVTFHDVPRELIAITGAPPFDRWLEVTRPTVDRAEFCRQSGLDPQRRFVVYLGSSAFIAEDETWLVEELAECLRTSAEPALRNLNVLVRPHPANVKIYSRLQLDNVRVWPHTSGLPQTRPAMEAYFNTLHYAECAVGLNTSGMIDAVVADKPCVALMVDRYNASQANIIHFQTLLHSAVFETAHSAADCLPAIARLLEGQDGNRALRQRFVDEFIRPGGRDKPAGQVAAEVIERAASRRAAQAVAAPAGAPALNRPV